MLASALPAPRRLLSALLLLPLLWWAGWAAAADLQPVPPLKAPVTDLAQLLSPAEAEALNRKLLDLDREKGSQVAVLIVPTTQPETIFDYSFRVADHWKLGRKGVDDGVLLVLAVKDRRSHLQVGYGLEGAIPDIRAKQILDDIMRPYFQQGQFAAGLDAGTDAVIRLINGEGLPAAAPRAQGQRRGNDSPFMMAVMAGLFGGMFLRAIFGRLLGGLDGHERHQHYAVSVLGRQSASLWSAFGDVPDRRRSVGREVRTAECLVGSCRSVIGHSLAGEETPNDLNVV
ncbi:MAG: TPM domain-containing protein, partial [Pseudomonadota bacterium]